MALNTNWPVLEYAWSPASAGANGGLVPGGPLVDVSTYTRSRATVQRGRQYETDQVRSGEYSHTWDNRGGQFDPSNSAGPWYGSVVPYQPFRIRAQWPPTANLLTQLQATGGDLGGYPTGSFPQTAGWESGTDVTGGITTTSGTAWQGTRVFQFRVPNLSPNHSPIAATRQPPVTPGTTYTLQVRVRNITPSTTLTVNAQITWSTLAGFTTPTRSSTQVLTGSASAAWTTITLTATAPANATGCYFGVETGAATTALTDMQLDGCQWERGSTATTWTAPGVWYPLYGGFVERYPAAWSHSGTYGTVTPTATDAFSMLSQIDLKGVFDEELARATPRFVLPLSDPSDSDRFADSTGTIPPAVLAVSKYGPGTITAGTQVTSASPTGGFIGSTGTVITVANPNPGSITNQPATFISLGSAGVLGPANPASWARMIAFRCTSGTPANASIIWSAFDSQHTSVPIGSGITLGIDNSGHAYFNLSGPTSGTVSLTLTSMAVADSNWHLAIFGYDNANMYLTIDGVSVTSAVGTGYAPTGIIGDNIGTYVDPTIGDGTSLNFQGDLALAAEFPAVPGTTRTATMYAAWRNAFTGDSANARYQRILDYAGYTGAVAIDTALTTSMGPALIAGQDALSALQGVVDTENGEHFVARDGTMTFRSRSARYNAITPAFTFGENTATGEWPYEDIKLDYDPTRVANLVQVTQASTSQVLTAADSGSQTKYFRRPLTRTVNSSSTNECQDAANYLLSRFKTPAQRVSGIRLHPSAMPALWPVCLSLELGTRVRVVRRPPAATAITLDCFVESIDWEFTEKGDATCTLQLSPADISPYGVFAAFHTQLNATISSGVTSIVIKAGADNQNPAAAQLPVNGQLILGLGTANQETVTIASVGTTTAGWTTATITLAAATTKAHTALDVVCELLPAGITDATTWDNSAKFDSKVFAY
ncbi:hypothetical protein KCMC57_64010 (plasmid) [Kitasatospora sp. CMC57]|uniref:LamG-like jellyroll fold domain-containing protein n=1 Tax=Kitasatospora sp. CMC57 TaxID=3231513 RepID=A0AB33K8N7_9ACTN